MAGSSAKRAQVKLAVVKAVLRPTFVAQDAFASEQVDCCKEYLAGARLEGVCVGALIGGEDWDVRPIIVEKGSLTLVRYGRPRSTFDSAEFHAYLDKVSSLNLPGMLVNGVAGGRIWTKRRFYRNTFAEIESDVHKESKLDRLTRFLKLVTVVKTLHDAGTFHGHLVSSNITWHDQIPVLLDHGFDFFEGSFEGRSLNDTGTESGQQADLVGLGTFMATLFAEELSPEEEKFVDSLLSSNAGLRPRIAQLQEFLSYRIVENKMEAEAAPPVIKLTVQHIEEPPVETPPPAVIEQEDDNAKVTLALSLPVIQEVEHTPSTRKVEISGRVLLLSLALFLVSYLGLYQYYFRPGSPGGVIADPVRYWKSRQPSLMQEVALAAVRSNDRVAQAVIIEDAASAEQPVQVRNDLIRTVFDPRWEAELSDNDRSLALKLALSSLIPSEAVDLPKLENVHPAVIFGILGSLPVGAALDQLKDVPLEGLSKLPSPIGSAFHELRPLGIYSVQDRSVRALSHLLQGKVSDETAAMFFDSTDDLITFIKLRAIAPILPENPALEDSVHLFLFTNSPMYAQMLRWFEDEPLADWGRVSRTDRIILVAGLPVKREFSFEQLGDLLMFPAEKVRSVARNELSVRYFAGKMVSLLKLIGSPDNKLSRSQTISILAAFLLTGSQADSFYTKWFAEKPDPSTVVAMLSLRSDVGNKDLFNYKAAEYLHTAVWQAPLDVMKRLLTNQEPLARALVYTRLNTSKPDELKLLRAMATAEFSPRLRKYIQQRLQAAK